MIMTKKKIYTILLAVIAAIVGFVISAKAETITQQQAKHIAAKFFNAAHGQYMAEPKFIYNGRKLTTQRLFSPFYVFNLPSGGFVIIAADNKAFPILAYNLKDTFDPNHIGPKLEAMLRQYAFDVERIRYDDRIPYQAIEAWNDIPLYINNILTAPNHAYDLLITPDEAAEKIDAAAADDTYGDNWSDLYSPGQWEELVAGELAKNRNVALGISCRNGIQPVIVQSQKGDYYRIATDIQDQTLYRLFATEYLSDGQIAVMDYAPGVPEEALPDDAFKFYEDFIAEQEADRQRRQKAIEDALIVTKPVLHSHGSGFYTVDLPEEAAVARIYNLSGAMVRQYTYGSTSSPHIDIIGEPTGFYFAQIIGKSGTPYGIKLVR